MGLLDAFKQYISDIGGSLNPEIGGLLAQTGETIKRNARQRDTVMKGLLADPSNRDLQRQAVAQGLDMASIAPIGMTVWHGSPHKFTKFDMSKIGTGEGAQAYGHGIYTAEAPEVAKSYMNAGGYLSSSPHKLAADSVSSMGSVDKALKHLEHILPPKGETTFSGQSRELIEDAIASVKNGAYKESGANLYKVDIPDEAVARMLDWDKKLSEQTPDVLKSIDGLLKERAAKALKSDQAAGFNRKLSFDEFYQRYLQQKPEGLIKADIGFSDPAKASEMLKSYGVPGIRYLDGGSRTVGSGSSNFVLFDDAMARILETNGIPTGLQAWKPGEWRGLLSP